MNPTLIVTLLLLGALGSPRSLAASPGQFNPACVADGSGGFVVAWEDHRAGTADIYAKALDPNGTVRWGGLPLCTASGDQIAPAIVADGAGGAIVAWQDTRSGTADIYVQRVRADGTVAWTTDGVAPCVAGNDQVAPAIVSDGVGGAIIVWCDYRNGAPDLYAQHVRASGVVAWTAGGVPVCTAANGQACPKLVADNAGGAIVTWQDARGGGVDIYAQRLMSNGATAWAADGVTLCAAGGDQTAPAIVADGTGGALVSWEDARGGAGTSDIYAQRVLAGGTVSWTADGVAVCAAGGGQIAPAIVADGSGGAIVAWQDARGGADIYAQRVSGDGGVAWTADGVALCTAANDQVAPVITTDGAGGAIVTWRDARGSSLDLYAQRIRSDGSVAWMANGIAVCVAVGTQDHPAMAADGMGGAVIEWEDLRDGTSSLYAARITATGSAVPLWGADGVAVVEGEDRDAHEVVSVPNGAGGAIHAWRSTGSSLVAQLVLPDGSRGWSPTGITVCSTSAWYPAIASDGSGGAIVVWEDYRTGGNGHIYAQRIKADGSPAWAADGVALCTAVNNEVAPAIVADGAGGAIVVWTDWRRNPTSDVYAQRVTAEGTVAWAVNGVAVCTAGSRQEYAAVTTDGLGGAVVTWASDRVGYNWDLYAQRVRSNGTMAWAANGVAVGTAIDDRTSPVVASDGIGGAIVAWNLRADATSDAVYAQHVKSDGTMGWTINGVALCSAGAEPGSRITPDGAGGAIVAWGDLRGGYNPIAVYAQRVSAAGTPVWTANGVPMCGANGLMMPEGLVPDGAGGAIVAWGEFGDPAGYQVYAQRVKGDGTVSWTADGMLLHSATESVGPAEAPDVSAIPDGAGGAIVSWLQGIHVDRSGALYVQRVGLDGPAAQVWSADGVTPTLLSLVSAEARPDRVRLTWFAADASGLRATVYRKTDSSGWRALGTACADGCGLIVFDDVQIVAGTRYGYRLGMVRGGAEALAGETWVNVPRALELALAGARPNPIAEDLTVAFSLPDATPARIELLDIGGRRITAREVGTLGAGNHVVNLTQGRTLAPGVYLLRLTRAGRSLTAPAIVIR